jgi:predicted XRE-type DNA-binding protein
MVRQKSRRGRSGDIQEERPLGPARAITVKRVLASQIEQAMNENNLTKAEMARRMATSRSQLNRLLDPDSDSVTLETVTRAARAVGRHVRLELVEGR